METEEFILSPEAASDPSPPPYGYGPFGEVIRATGPMAKANPLRFSTKYQDDETDLLYYGYRYYSPATGRWATRDPMGQRGGNNLYGFVQNDAVNFLDLLGLLGGPGKYSECSHCRNSEWRSVKIGFALLYGSDADGARVGKDLFKSFMILKQCCVLPRAKWYRYWDEPTTRKALGDLVVDVARNNNVDAPPKFTSMEEKRLTQGQSGMDGDIYAYYVKRIHVEHTLDWLRGKAYWQDAYDAPPANAVLVANSAVPDTFTHELGHVLLGTGAHSQDPNNLMADGSSRNGNDALTEEQCDKIRQHPAVASPIWGGTP
jgi:RHS repeat-associated protein